jgi:phage terminase large subunit-like protein
LLRAYLESLSPEERLQYISGIGASGREVVRHSWRVWARDNQLPPDGDWLVWLLLAGRGFGKTRTGAEYVRECVESGAYGRVALVAATAADVRDVLVEGESGLLACAPPWCRPTYEPSKRRLTWPNGALATCYSADEPDRLRGPQHDLAWADELAAWRYADAWDMLMFTLRLGAKPRAVVTTTPRPKALVRQIFKSPTTVVTRGSTRDNLVNLAPPFASMILAKYEGTTLGRQEIDAELLDEMPGALWKRGRIDELRVQEAPALRRAIVALDPSVTNNKDSDEAGIIWGGLASNGHVYVCGDLSVRGSSDEWARRTVGVYRERKLDRIVYESNQGGDLVASTLRTVDKNAALTSVHASRGKRVRAEPVAALYEQGRVHHVGVFAQLEDQLANWVPGDDDSPDRLDALVYLVTELTEGAATLVAPGGAVSASRWG